MSFKETIVRASTAHRSGSGFRRLWFFDRHLLRLRCEFGGHRHADLEYAVGERRLDVFGLDALRQRHRAVEAAMLAFGAIEVVFLLLGFALAVTGQGEIAV